jgi:Domain of unknown function (DUF4386)
LIYIAAAFPSMVLMGRATGGAGIAEQLVSLAQHANQVYLATVLSMIGSFCALVLAVTLWAITRDQDPDLAMLGLTCRVTEGVTGAVSLPGTLVLLSLVTAAGATAPNAGGLQVLGAFVLKQDPLIAATFFAVGSTVFSSLLLRGRMIPLWLGWLGVIGSALLIITVPLQLTHVLGGVVTQLMWVPVAIFELVVAVWLIVKGVASPEISR